MSTHIIYNSRVKKVGKSNSAWVGSLKIGLLFASFYGDIHYWVWILLRICSAGISYKIAYKEVPAYDLLSTLANELVQLSVRIPFHYQTHVQFCLLTSQVIR